MNDEMYYRALMKMYTAYERCKVLFGHPCDFTGMTELPEPAAPEEARALIKTVSEISYDWHNGTALRRMTWQLKISQGEMTFGKSFPADVETVLTEEEIWEAVGDNRIWARRIVLDYFMDWAMCHGTWFPELIRRVVKDYKSRSTQDSQKIMDILGELARDLVTSTELTDLLEYSPQRVGQVLRNLGHERRRISGKGDHQSIWIIGNHSKYHDMTNKELKSAWETMMSDSVDTMDQSAVSFI